MEPLAQPIPQLGSREAKIIDKLDSFSHQSKLTSKSLLDIKEILRVIILDTNQSILAMGRHTRAENVKIHTTIYTVVVDIYHLAKDSWDIWNQFLRTFLLALKELCNPSDPRWQNGVHASTALKLLSEIHPVSSEQILIIKNTLLSMQYFSYNFMADFQWLLRRLTVLKGESKDDGILFRPGTIITRRGTNVDLLSGKAPSSSSALGPPGLQHGIGRTLPSNQTSKSIALALPPASSALQTSRVLSHFKPSVIQPRKPIFPIRTATQVEISRKLSAAIKKNFPIQSYWQKRVTDPRWTLGDIYPEKLAPNTFEDLDASTTPEEHILTDNDKPIVVNAPRKPQNYRKRAGVDSITVSIKTPVSAPINRTSFLAQSTNAGEASQSISTTSSLTLQTLHQKSPERLVDVFQPQSVVSSGPESAPTTISGVSSKTNLSLSVQEALAVIGKSISHGFNRDTASETLTVNNTNLGLTPSGSLTVNMMDDIYRHLETTESEHHQKTTSQSENTTAPPTSVLRPGREGRVVEPSGSEVSASTSSTGEESAARKAIITLPLERNIKIRDNQSRKRTAQQTGGDPPKRSKIDQVEKSDSEPEARVTRATAAASRTRTPSPRRLRGMARPKNGRRS